MDAWHWLSHDQTLRGGAPAPPDDVPLVHHGPLVLRGAGFHASVGILDAMKYAPGPVVCRVDVGEERLGGPDKLVARVRTIRWRIDATAVLERFLRRCAEDVAHLWPMPGPVRRFLASGADRDAAVRALAECASVGPGRAARAAAAQALTPVDAGSACSVAGSVACLARWAAWDDAGDEADSELLARQSARLAAWVTEAAGR
ncbi:MAG: hypothetical protein R3F59_02630 [Myxococcota bacterium]